MRYRPCLWLFVLGASVGVSGCKPAEQPAIEHEPIAQSSVEEDNEPVSKMPPEPVAERPVLEWQWQELVGPLDRFDNPVVFSQDGKLVAAGAKDTISVWSVETGKLVTRMLLPVDQSLCHLAFTADGKSLVSDCREDLLIRFWDLKTGKQTREFPHPPPDPQHKPANGSFFKAFDPKGAFLIRNGLLKSATTYPIRGLVVVDLTAEKVSAEVNRRLSDWDDLVGSVVFAPDSKTFACNTRINRLELYETSSGKLVKALQPGDPKLSTWGEATVHFSPDGRFLIAREYTGKRGPLEFNDVIWGVEDGRRYWQREHRRAWISAGNRYVLSDTKTVHDLLTDQDVPIKNEPADRRTLVGMSADGKVLAFVGAASEKAAPGTQGFRKLSVYLTPAPVLPLPGDPGRRELTAVELEEAWVGGVADNLFRRERSLKMLGMRPAQTLALAEAKLKPVSEDDGKRVAELVRKLDDDNVTVRDAATEGLHRVSHRFERYLRDAQKAAEFGEVRNRLIRVIQKLQESSPPPELVADIRVIALLEQLRNVEARKQIEKLAGGFRGARVTDEAAAALTRLDKPQP